jgi:hypothetical protein
LKVDRPPDFCLAGGVDPSLWRRIVVRLNRVL